jgi:hypothetical protein
MAAIARFPERLANLVCNELSQRRELLVVAVRPLILIKP